MIGWWWWCDSIRYESRDDRLSCSLLIRSSKRERISQSEQAQLSSFYTLLLCWVVLLFALFLESWEEEQRSMTTWGKKKERSRLVDSLVERHHEKRQKRLKERNEHAYLLTFREILHVTMDILLTAKKANSSSLVRRHEYEQARKSSSLSQVEAVGDYERSYTKWSCSCVAWSILYFLRSIYAYNYW